jgi:hypothetical protein
MNDLHQHLRDILDDQDTDLGVIAARAQHDGTRIRRRRRLVVAGALLASVAVLGAATSDAILGGEGIESTRVTDTTPAPTPQPVTALDALESGLATVSPGGTVSVTQAEKTWRDAGRPYAMVTVVFTPAGATGGSEVMVQYKAAVDGSKEAIEECDGSQPHCEVSTLANGGVIQISDTPFHDKVSGEGANQIAALYIDGTVVTLWARVPTSGSGRTLAPRPVLTRDELKDVLSQPGWADLKTVK